MILFSLQLLYFSCFGIQLYIYPTTCFIYLTAAVYTFLPCAYAAGLSDWFCLSVVCVCRLSVHSKTGIYRVKRLLNPTEPLKVGEKMSECVPDKDQGPSILVMARSFLFAIDRVRHFQYGQQLGYEGRRKYADICGVRAGSPVPAWIFQEVGSVPLFINSIFLVICS